MVVVSGCRLAAVIALRRDPAPELFRLDTVTVASSRAVAPWAPADEPAEPNTPIIAPATSRTINDLRMRHSLPPWTPTRPCLATTRSYPAARWGVNPPIG